MTNWRHDVIWPLLAWVVWLVTTCNGTRYWDYVVVGAGPGGLQMAHFLQKAGRNYVVLERSKVPGSFYMKYPRHDKLISINKMYTGQSNNEFNLRHDWNSLISDDDSLLFRNYDTAFYPHRKSMLTYLNAYVHKLGLNVLYEREVSNVSKTCDSTRSLETFHMHDQWGSTYTCRYLIIATGLSVPNIPDIEGIENIEGYEDVSTDPKAFQNKAVLILGAGNSGFETATAIHENTQYVHVAGSSRIKLAWETHYVGDLRAVNNNLLDTYQLKSLDGVLAGDLHTVAFVMEGDKISVRGSHEEDDNTAVRVPYDHVIRCLGFLFDDSMFTNTTRPKLGKRRRSKYPKIDSDHSVVDVPGMYVAGTASHYNDYRKSAGGFIHGFRYTTESMHRLMEWKHHNVPWPSQTVSFDNLLPLVLKRVNEASAIYQMFAVLGDVILLNRNTSTVTYLTNFPISMLHRLSETSGHTTSREVIVLNMEYGENYSGAGNDVFRDSRATGDPHLAHQSNFLHPVFYYYKQLPTKKKKVPTATLR